MKDLSRSGQSRVVIVGGGLAGLAAAVALSEQGGELQVLETRRQLGGRAGSFWDAASGEWIDHCQHVNLGCCVNYADFCRRTGLGPLLHRDATLHFFAPDGRRYDLSASRWLPAPWHLAPALLRLGFLSLRERLAVARAMRRLAWPPRADRPPDQAIADWLRQQGQSGRAIERFWTPVLVSALSESLDNIALEAARKVFVDGFLATSDGYVLETPRVPLQKLFERSAIWLESRGVRIRQGARVREVVVEQGVVRGVRVGSEPLLEADAVIAAVPWRQLPEMLGRETLQAIPHGDALRGLPSAPISSVHLWFDRLPIPLPHAVLVSRLSQWVFCRPSESADGPAASLHHCQVVISASRSIEERPRDETLAQVLTELQDTWPALADARLVKWRIVTATEAVLSPRPGVSRLRPPPTCGVSNLFLAGDWTQTGWPSTMEGAVRSGYRAAEALLAARGIERQFVLPEPRTWLTRRLLDAPRW